MQHTAYMEYESDNENHPPKVKVEIHLSYTLSNPYLYGADSDGRRGEERQDIEDVVIDEIVIPTEGDLPEALTDEIRAYYENWDQENWEGVMFA